MSEPRTVDAWEMVNDPDMLTRAYSAIYATTLDDTGKGAELEITKTLDTLMLAAALIIDVHPDQKTAKDTRLAADEVRELTKKLLMALAERKKEFGEPLLTKVLGDETYHRPRGSTLN